MLGQVFRIEEENPLTAEYFLSSDIWYEIIKTLLTGCRSCDILSVPHYDCLKSDFNSRAILENPYISLSQTQGHMCIQARLGWILTQTHRCRADFVVLSEKERAVRLHMELSMKTKSKMRNRCRIPCACWGERLERREKERGGGHY